MSCSLDSFRQQTISFTKSNIFDITVHFCVRKNNIKLLPFLKRLALLQQIFGDFKKPKRINKPKQTKKIENNSTILGTLLNLSDSLYSLEYKSLNFRDSRNSVKVWVNHEADTL